MQWGLRCSFTLHAGEFDPTLLLEEGGMLLCQFRHARVPLPPSPQGDAHDVAAGDA